MARPPRKESNKEEAAKDQELNRKIEEILSLVKDMAGKSNLSRSVPRYVEMLSFMKEIAVKALKQKMKEDAEVVQEEVPFAGESSKKGEEDHGERGNSLSLLLKVKRGVKTDREKKTRNSLDLQEVRRSMREPGKMRTRIKRRSQG